jgi:hypothetical protein
MSHLDGAILHGIEHLQTGHDFSGGEKLDLEFVVGGLCDRFAHLIGAAVNRVQRLRPARRHPPLQFRHRLRNCRRRNRRSTRNPKPCDLDKISTFHASSLAKLFASLHLSRPVASMEHPDCDFHPRPDLVRKKARPLNGTGPLLRLKA